MKVLFLYDGMNGGISECAEYLAEASAGTCLKIRKFQTHGRMAFSILAFLPRLVMFSFLLATRKFDVCHINVASRGSTVRKYFYSRFCKLFGTPYVLHLHGAKYREFYDALSPFFRRRVDKLFHDAAFVIVLGKVWADFVASEIGVPAAKIEILQNAIDGPRNPPAKSSGRPNIAFLGRLGPRKGIGEVIQALATDGLRQMDWHMDVCGDGDLAPYIDLAKKVGIHDKLTFHGWVGRPGVRAVLEKSHIFVLPSHAENLPLALLEAMAYRACPVVTPVGAMAEVIENDVNGLLVPVSSPPNIAAALVRLLSEPATTNRLADKARADFMRNHDIDAYRGRLSAAYAFHLSAI